MTSSAATDIAAHHVLDDLARARFAWPEAVLIDLISESYGEPPGEIERMAAARLHVRFLHELTDGDARKAVVLRLDLIACCAARGIAIAAIEAADAAAFREIISIVRTRFRNSPRLQLQALQHLHAALSRLPRREPEPVKPAPRPALWLRTRAISPRSGLVAA